MKVLDAICGRAERDLVFVDLAGRRDTYLWESARRIAAAARLLLQLPEVQQFGPSRVATLAAAYYHDAGYLPLLRDGALDTAQIRTGATRANHHDVAAATMELSLADILDADTLDTATQAVRTLPMRRLQTSEAMVVSDAENLDRIGVMGLWSAARSSVLSGRGIDEILEKWRLQCDYRFWQACIADTFHFETTRKLAAARFESLTSIMEHLQRTQRGDDLAESLNGAALRPGAPAAGPAAVAITSRTTRRRSPRADP